MRRVEVISMYEVKKSWLVFIVTWCEECGRKKRRKRGRNKRKGHTAKTFPAKLVVQFTDCKNSILLHALLSVDLSTAGDLSLPT